MSLSASLNQLQRNHQFLSACCAVAKLCNAKDAETKTEGSMSSIREQGLLCIETPAGLAVCCWDIKISGFKEKERGKNLSIIFTQLRVPLISFSILKLELNQGFLASIMSCARRLGAPLL